MSELIEIGVTPQITLGAQENRIAIATAPDPDTTLQHEVSVGSAAFFTMFVAEESTAIAMLGFPVQADIVKPPQFQNPIATAPTPDTVLNYDLAHSYRVIPWFPRPLKRTNGDLPPLTLSDIAAINITKNSADIVWKTDRACTSGVDYGRDVSYGLYKGGDPGGVTEHLVHLTGLTPGMLYHFRVKSWTVDGPGMWAASDDYTFTTLADGGDDPGTPETQMHASVITLFLDEPTGRKDYSYEGLSVDNDSLV